MSSLMKSNEIQPETIFPAGMCSRMTQSNVAELFGLGSGAEPSNGLAPESGRRCVFWAGMLGDTALGAGACFPGRMSAEF